MANPLQAMPSATLQIEAPSNTAAPSGIFNITWYRFFLNLWNRTGGASGDTSGLPVENNQVSGTFLNAAALNSAVLVRSGPSGAFTDTIDTATNYVKAHNFPISPSTNYSVFINATEYNWTIAANNTINFQGNLTNGNYVIPANSQRTMTFEITNISPAGVTVYA